MLLNGTSMNSMLYLMESHCEHNVIEWNINEFNVLLNGIPLSSMLLNGTSVNSMFY
jgi:hypothetical protein